MIKIIDKRSYKFFIYLFIVGVVLYSIAFYFLSLFSMGIESTMSPKEIVGIPESLYFSIVTITSLGYGDFRPISFGRYVAMTEVIYGLIIIALIVSKLASERTSTIVRLIYTSDIEKRIKEFIESNTQINYRLKKAIEEHDYKVISELSNDFKISFSSYLHFLAFHAKQGEIEGRWAEKSFLKLLRNISKSAELLSHVMRLKNLSASERLRCEKAFKRAIKFGNALQDLYQEQNIIGNSNHILKMYENVISHVKRVESGDAPEMILTKLTPALLERVRDELPDDNWPKNIHKEIATNLRISNGLAHKAISQIVSGK